jgi:threonine/homoserine/homoserine lactone efflux protein
MDLLSFIISIFLISLSGVLMPGPVFATAIAEGRKNKYAGILISTGHAIVEVPLMMVLFFFGTFEMNLLFKTVIQLAGGLALLYFAFSVLRAKSSFPLKGLIAGIILSSLNPYFIIWWLTIGFTLALQATNFGIIGLILLVTFHESCDFMWYQFVSYASYKGMKFKHFKHLSLMLSFVIMLLFGFYFLYQGIVDLI